MNNDLLSNRFLKEIYEQPAVLKDTLDFYLNNGGRARLSKAVNYRDEKQNPAYYFYRNGKFILHSRYGINNTEQLWYTRTGH